MQPLSETIGGNPLLPLKAPSLLLLFIPRERYHDNKYIQNIFSQIYSPNYAQMETKISLDKALSKREILQSFYNESIEVRNVSSAYNYHQQINEIDKLISSLRLRIDPNQLSLFS